MLPKTINGWITLLVGIALAVMPAYMATVGKAPPLWAVLLNAGLGYLALYLRGGVPKPKLPPGTAAGVIALLAIGLMASACSPYSAAWRTLDGVQQARNLTAQQLARVARVKHADCLKAHTRKTPEFGDCMRAHDQALKHWRTIARPAINSAIQITATSLHIAERLRPDKQPDWLALLKPAACALMRVAKAWGHWYPDKGAAILGALTMVEAVTCE
jgi:hypothetical protein